MVRCGLLLVTLLVVSTTAFAAHRFRPKNATDDDACYRDSQRFCRDAVPDQLKVLACLQDHRAKLSRACVKELTDNGV